eukprot:1333768-Amorphochlora_amoeboformis.AAC.1
MERKRGKGVPSPHQNTSLDPKDILPTQGTPVDSQDNPPKEAKGWGGVRGRKKRERRDIKYEVEATPSGGGGRVGKGGGLGASFFGEGRSVFDMERDGAENWR